jgi:GrpB protein
VDVVAPGEAAVGPAITGLAAAGWRHQGDLGIEGREAFAPHRDHVDLRDCLRAHPGRAARYGELKHHLAGLLATGRLAYGEGKAEMNAEFLRQARTGPGRSVRCVRE